MARVRTNLDNHETSSFGMCNLGAINNKMLSLLHHRNPHCRMYSILMLTISLFSDAHIEKCDLFE